MPEDHAARGTVPEVSGEREKRPLVNEWSFYLIIIQKYDIFIYNTSPRHGEGL